MKNGKVIDGVEHELVKSRIKGFDADGHYKICVTCSLFKMCHVGSICDFFDENTEFHYFELVKKGE